MSSLSDPSLRYIVRWQVVVDTLDFLKLKGVKGHEGVVLWPATLNGDSCAVDKPLVPAQETGPLSYSIPDEEVFRILQFVAERNLVIPIQVHSHPKRAFHSCADDERAFVQHENGISIVVPNFGRFPESDFLSRARFYRLRRGSIWEEIADEGVARIFRFARR